MFMHIFLNQDLSLQKLCQTSLAEFPVLGTHPAQQVGSTGIFLVIFTSVMMNFQQLVMAETC